MTVRITRRDLVLLALAVAGVVLWRADVAGFVSLRGLRELATPKTAEDFWAAVGTVVNAALLGVAVYGLRSLRLTRRDMVTRATREAAAFAIQRAEEWATEIIPLNASVLTMIAAHSVPVFVTTADQVNFDRADAKLLNRAQAWQDTLPHPLFAETLTLLNRLEGWAMYFTTGVADPKIAYGPCAPTFCSMVVQSYALILLFRSDPGSGNYPNLVQLFRAWSGELEEAQRGLVRGTLLQELAKLQKQGPRTELRKPIGTDLDD